MRHFGWVLECGRKLFGEFSGRWYMFICENEIKVGTGEMGSLLRSSMVDQECSVVRLAR